MVERGREVVRQWLYTLILLGGLGQIALILGSLGIPRVLGWKSKLATLSPLLRQMFWVYSLYIWLTNLCFGLVSALATDALLDGSLLATCLTGFIFGYWLLRMAVQWFWFDISELPSTRWHIAARWILELLFTGLTLVYGAAMLWNLGWLPAASHGGG